MAAAEPAEDVGPDESTRLPASEGLDSETRGATSPGAPRLRRLHGLVDAVRRVWSPQASLAPVEEVMARIHRAGGLVFLAHPLQPVGDLDRLESLLRLLKAIGLDGLEALYKPYPREVRSVLTRLAGRHDLLVSGGSDYHGDGHRGSSLPGCNVPRWHWDRFRRALALHGCEEGGPK